MGIFNFFSKEAKEKRKEKERAEQERIYNEALTNVLNGKDKEAGKMLLFLMPLKAIGKYTVDYVGGHYAEPNPVEDTQVLLLEEGLIFKSLKNGDVIRWSEIEKVELQSRQTVEKDLTIPRMVAFGVYALALKKKKKVVSQFLIIHCKLNNESYKIVIAGDEASKLYGDMFERLAV